jgi:signal transduction histidine kinase
VVNAGLLRYEPDGTGLVVAVHYQPGRSKMPGSGERIPLAGDDLGAKVLRTGRAARIDNHDNARGPETARIREAGIHSTVGVPIRVDGRLWGAAIVGSRGPEPMPADTEARVGDFADLVATAIANAATRTELIASRARIVAAANDARRRLERDLHDGAQQRLISLGLQLRMAEESAPPEFDDFKQQLSRILSGLTGVSADLHEISRGIHPAILAKGGLGPALKTLARRSAVPVTLDLRIDRRIPDSAQVAAYYVVAEALTNTAKHARASEVNVGVETEGGSLRVLIRDDGVGGANSHNGSGLIGLQDRVEALGGHLHVTSPPQSGTSLHVTIPLDGD